VVLQVAQAKYEKSAPKPAPFGWDAFNQAALYNAYDKRASKVPVDKAAYEATKQAAPDVALEKDPMEYGKMTEVRAP
jgi:pre-mRNA-splicing factor SYF2